MKFIGLVVKNNGKKSSSKGGAPVVEKPKK